MSKKVANIAKNTSYFTLALILQKIISFSYFTILARTLVPEELGKFYFAISFTTLFAIVADIGLGNVVMREVAKRQKESSKILSSVILIKIPFAIIAILSIFIISQMMDYPALTLNLIYLSTFCMLLDSFALIFWGTIRAQHDLRFESISSIVFQLIVMTLGLIVLHFNLGLQWLMLGLLCASLFHFIFSLLLIIFKWNIKISFIPDYKLIKSIVILALPFAMFGVLNKLYLYLDTVLLQALAGDKYVGLYQIAFKIVFALQFLPMAFVASLYPAFSKYWVENKKQLSITFERSINYLIIISIPISTGIATLADKIILLFKPEYAEAVPSLQIIMFGLIFIFINFPVGSLLNACDRQKTNTMNMALGLAMSVTINFMLIPDLNTVGAAIAVALSNAFMFALGIYFVPQIIDYKPWNNILPAIKVGFSAIVMAGVIIYLKSNLNLFLVIAIGGTVYLGSLFLLAGFKKDDVMSIYNSFRKK